MGYVIAMGTCANCGQVFSFNPHKVPSILIKGRKEPVCRECMEIANKRREEIGLPPFPIEPDAYEEIEESQL